MGFSRQEYWSELPFPTPRDSPYPGIKPMTPALAGGFFTAEPPRKPYESWRIWSGWAPRGCIYNQLPGWVCAVGAWIKLWAARILPGRSDLQWWVSFSSEELGFLSWIRNFYAIYRVCVCFPCWGTSYHKFSHFKQLPFIISWFWWVRHLGRTSLVSDSIQAESSYHLGCVLIWS